MIIAVLKEGSAGLLPLSGAAPAIYLGGVEDEGEQGEQSKCYYSSDHFHACTGNIWGIFHSNIFNTKFSKKREGIMTAHFSLQLEDKDNTNFLKAQALLILITLTWRDLLSLPSLQSIQSCPLLWCGVDTCLLAAELWATDWIYQSQTTWQAEAS